MEQGQTEIEAISAEITLFRQKYLLSVSFCSFGYLTVDFCFLPKLHILKPPLSVSAETLSVAHYFAKCIKNAKNANNAITMRFALIAVGAIAFFSFCANMQTATIM